MTILRSACRHQSDPACALCVVVSKFEAAEKVAKAADAYDKAYFSNSARHGTLTPEAQAIASALKEWRRIQ